MSTFEEDCVEVTIQGCTARISSVRGSYLAIFLDGPMQGKEVSGDSVRRAWFALRDLMTNFDSNEASVTVRTG
jgi:hypothetical protein